MRGIILCLHLPRSHQTFSNCLFFPTTVPLRLPLTLYFIPCLVGSDTQPFSYYTYCTLICYFIFSALACSRIYVFYLVCFKGAIFYLVHCVYIKPLKAYAIIKLTFVFCYISKLARALALYFSPVIRYLNIKLIYT